MTIPTHKVSRVLFFASFRELLGLSGIDVTLNHPITVTALLQQLYTDYPAIAGHLASRELLFAVNQQLASADSLVQPGDEVAIFPFVTGG